MFLTTPLTLMILTLTTPVYGDEPMSFYAVNPKILAWLPEIHAARERADLSPAKYSDALLLALLHRETDPIGDASSHREGSPFYGGLQMFDDYVLDATQAMGLQPFSAIKIQGKPDVQLDLFFAYMERYARRHDYRPSWIAATHKAGPGSMREVARLIREGEAKDLMDALVNHITIYNDDHYVRTWRKLFAMYARWVETKNMAHKACSAAYLGDFDELELPEIPGLAD